MDKNYDSSRLWFKVKENLRTKLRRIFMKKFCRASIMLLLFSLSALLLSACTDSKNIGIIGGSDGPTKIVTDSNKGDKLIYEKDSVKMVRINGSLYYETDEENETYGQSTVIDGTLQKTADKFEIPQNDGGANFSGSKGYKNGTIENTVEILLDDDWEIFKKIDANTDVLKYKYCYIVESDLPNSTNDGEFLVLANEKDITPEDAAYKMSGSDKSKMKDIYVLPVFD